MTPAELHTHLAANRPEGHGHGAFPANYAEQAAYHDWLHTAPGSPDAEHHYHDTAWHPRYRVTKAPHVGGPPIPDDEPCLVIRAQDPLAAYVLNAYLTAYRARYGAKRDLGVDRDLQAHADTLNAWQAAHPDRVKMADR